MVFNFDKKHFCGIGSVKSNIGHLDAAAGVTGLIKTILSLKHRIIPPSLHVKTPNPKLGLENSPFYVVSTLTPWRTLGNGIPRRAGVSSLGIGGTNAHVVLEEAPAVSAPPTASLDREYNLLLLSARTPSALEKITVNLVDYLNKNIIGFEDPVSSISSKMADIAYTLQTGRKHFPYRKMIVCASGDTAGAAAVLSSNSRKVQTALVREEKPRVIFMFPAQGVQYVNMGLGLYREESVFRQELDRCFDLMISIVGKDVRGELYPENEDESTGVNSLIRTDIIQPVLFSFEYALAKLLMSWGIIPSGMIGHSFGQYTAACLSGVFSLEDALQLVILRGQLMERTSPGVMLSVSQIGRAHV